MIVGGIVGGLLLVAFSGLFFVGTPNPSSDRPVTQRQLEEVQRQLNEAKTRLEAPAEQQLPPSTGAPPTSTGTNVTVALPRSIILTIAVPPNMIPPPPDPHPTLGPRTRSVVAILGAITTLLATIGGVIKVWRGKSD